MTNDEPMIRRRMKSAAVRVGRAYPAAGIVTPKTAFLTSIDGCYPRLTSSRRHTGFDGVQGDFFKKPTLPLGEPTALCSFAESVIVGYTDSAESSVIHAGGKASI